VKVYISADMEGVAGITAEEQTNPIGQPEYARSCALMTGEVKAACDGALAAGADEIVVNDSHWNMRNIVHDDLPPSVRLIRGSLKPMSMVEGLDASFSAALFVGYHAGAGQSDAVLDHTYSGETIYEVRVNGERCSEARLNAAVAGALAVPVVFVSGDQSACRDAASFLPWAQTAEVKRAIGRYAAASLSPQEARATIKSGVERALREAGSRGARPFAFSPPLWLEIDFTATARADVAALLPGARRVTGRTVSFAHDDFLTLFRAFRALTLLGASIS